MIIVGFVRRRICCRVSVSVGFNLRKLSIPFMPRALLLSPHLDDVAFSCAATARHLLRGGWDVQLVTVFTGSVENPQGFALACQLDKGLAPDVDYMKLRRAEDLEFCRIVGLENTAHWPFLEAPHRGYESAPELFAGIKDGDEIWKLIAAKLEEIATPDTVFAPQGLGNHVDHLQVIRAVRARGWDAQAFWYRDTPYAIRQPDAAPSALLPDELSGGFVAFDEAEMEIKIAGCRAYASQIGFQFGGADGVAAQLRAFHRAEAERVDREPFAERFVVSA